MVGRCYTHHGYAKLGVNSLIKANSGRIATEDEIVEAVRGLPVRFGAYGEPVILGEHLVSRMAEAASSWTGYTHQWRNPKFQWARKFFMASVHSPEEAERAHSMGWRTFRVLDEGSEDKSLLRNEILCPAGEAGGHRTTCSRCKLCAGTSTQARSIVEYEH